MLRFFAGVASTLLLVAAGFFIWKSHAEQEALIPPPPEPQPAVAHFAPYALEPVAEPPAAPEKTKEEKRFDRADCNKDGRITKDELLEPRRKAFAKLDKNGDGRLSFDE